MEDEEEVVVAEPSRGGVKQNIWKCFCFCFCFCEFCVFGPKILSTNSLFKHRIKKAIELFLSSRWSRSHSMDGISLLNESGRNETRGLKNNDLKFSKKITNATGSVTEPLQACNANQSQIALHQ